MRTVLLIALALSPIARVTGAAQEKPASPLELWLDAASAHTAGHADEAARTVGDWPKDELLRVLRHVDEAPSPNPAIQRGAVLHLDIALLVDARAAGRLFASYPKTGPAPPPTPALVVDGTGAGSGAASTHLEFVRALLKKMTPAPAGDEFARVWYVASAAELARRKNLSELEVHLDHAREMLPDDPEILLASGCLRESFAAPAPQSAARQQSSIAVGSRSANLRAAERHFRAALQADPDLAEARLRLGRVLGLQGDHEEALPELQRALDLADDRVQTYYALLLLGRSEEALGRLGAARGHFERAWKLFPPAQAPPLALSRLALERGDEREAQRVLQEAIDTTRSGVGASDPWWVYDLGPGRYADRKRLQLHLALDEEMK